MAKRLGLGACHSIGRGGASGIIFVRRGDFSRHPGPDSMGGGRVSCPGWLNPRFMLTPMIPFGPMTSGLLRQGAKNRDMSPEPAPTPESEITD